MIRKRSKRLVFGGAVSISCLLTFVLLYAAFSSSIIDPFDTWKQKLSYWTWNIHNSKIDLDTQVPKEPLNLLFKRLVTGEDQIDELDSRGFLCHLNNHSDVCLTNKPVMVDYNRLTVYVPSIETPVVKHIMIKPYARKDDKKAMKDVTAVKIVEGNSTTTNNNNNNLPPAACKFNHSVPVLIFSSGGFTGNPFHEFNEIIIPLFLTSHHFQSHVQFLISDFNSTWVGKYKKVLAHLSRYKVMDMAGSKGGSHVVIHCFPGAVIGLNYHGILAINSEEIPKGYSMPDFRNFLRETYNLKEAYVVPAAMAVVLKPRLLLLSRRGSRRFINQGELKKLMKEVGFEVIVASPKATSNLDKFAGLVNSCSVMVGVHGAGLTNQVFLPDGAVVVQVVPLGIDWASTNYFGEPATKMGLHYLEYKIEAEESSLFVAYGPNHSFITNSDPLSVYLMGYPTARAVYIDQQNVIINVERFTKTLVQALNLLGGR